jgi:hypothetical protein
MNKILFAAPNYFLSYGQVGNQHYAKLLSKYNWKVIHCSNFLSPFNLLLSKNRKDIKMRFLNHINGGEYINDNLLSYVSFTFLPHHNKTIFDKRWFLYNYYKFSIPRIESVLKREGFKNVDVLWLDCPAQIFWKNIIKFKKFIYRIPDAIEEYSNSGKVLLDAHEEAIISSDVVIVASKVLMNELNNKYKNVNFLYCPNGVDLSNFLKKDYHEPHEYRGIKGRRALYVGSIDEWFNEDLLIYLADNSSGINYFIIGPDKLGKMKSIKRSNIYYLGPKEYKEIPDYIFYSNFGIIPFKSSKLVRCINPIKMYEFLSLGKPVVSTAWEELQELNAPIYLAHNQREFICFIKDIDKNKEKFKKEELINFARNNTWETRYNMILEKLLLI